MSLMIKLTELAIEKVREFATDQGFNDLIVRIGVLGGGCAGFSYNFEFVSVSEIKDTDEIFDNDGIKIIVDPMSYQYLNEVEIDFVNNGLFSGFKFNNPNSKGSCGCGTSFYV
jgi:iron-sulfur cluster assembly accessory protein